MGMARPLRRRFEAFEPDAPTDLTDLTASADELNRTSDVSSRLVAAGATLSATELLHDGEVEDIKANLWHVTGGLTCVAGSNVADPFSATVS